MPARIIYSWAEFVSLIIYNIDEIFTSVLKTGVFCLYTIWAGMDVLQSFFGGRLLSAHIRPFTSIKNLGISILHFTFYIFNCLSGLARMSSISSGEELMTPASPVILRAGTDVLQKILRGKIFWPTPCPARL